MPYSSQPGMMHPYPSFSPCPPGLPGYMDPDACKLKVQGKGTVKVQPDTAIIILGVVTENMQLKAAQEENSRIVANILDILRNMGIPSKDITTQSYVIEPQYDYIEGKQVFRGYRVSHSLRITVRDISKVGEVIDAAVEGGANVVNSISFTVSDPSKYYRQALNVALEDAYVKSVSVGEKLTIRVCRVPVRIAEESEPYGVPVPLTLSQPQAMTTPIQPGQIEITARITAIYTYEYIQ